MRISSSVLSVRYSLKDGASFAEQAQHATFDLTGDDGLLTGRQRHHKQLKWDRKKKKFIQGGGEGADNVKLIKTESGARLPATYRSGRFEEWKAKNKTSLPRVGEIESERAKKFGTSGFGKGGRKFRYNTSTEAKPLDPKSLGYDRKVRLLKKRSETYRGAGEGGDDGGRTGLSNRPSPGKRNSGGKAAKSNNFRAANINKVKSELKSAEQIRKSRTLKARKKSRNARPSKRGR
jgi:ATP-dependent RNA helicase DDX54/DBP10